MNALLAVYALVMAPMDAPSSIGGASRTGSQVVQQQCILCHGAGVGGAPKVGDRNAWNKRLAKGVDGLAQSAIAGRGAMPPRGGLADLSDAEVRAAVVHMLHASGAAGGEEP